MVSGAVMMIRPTTSSIGDRKRLRANLFQLPQGHNPLPSSPGVGHRRDRGGLNGATTFTAGSRDLRSMLPGGRPSRGCKLIDFTRQAGCRRRAASPRAKGTCCSGSCSGEACSSARCRCIATQPFTRARVHSLTAGSRLAGAVNGFSFIFISVRCYRYFACMSFDAYIDNIIIISNDFFAYCFHVRLNVDEITRKMRWSESNQLARASSSSIIPHRVRVLAPSHCQHQASPGQLGHAVPLCVRGPRTKNYKTITDITRWT